MNSNSSPMMFSALVLNLLLLVSFAAARYYGGSVTFSPKGTNPNGTMRVEIRFKQTYDWCGTSNWYCASGNCGYQYSREYSEIDKGSNGWCQTETIVIRDINGNTPFELMDNSCCWVPTVNNLNTWFFQTHVDLGIRSDTNQPNQSPVTTTLQLLRVPQNCPRKYHLIAFDPDGDQIKCRYGTRRLFECDRCDQPSGFQIDQDTCTLDYSYTYSTGVYGFELIVEDFPKKHTTLSYTDGSSSYRCPSRRSQSSIVSTDIPLYYQETTVPWWQQQQINTTINSHWWWWTQQMTTEQPTTTTSPWWLWRQQQNATEEPTTAPWWWTQQMTTEPPTMATSPSTHQQYDTYIGQHDHIYEPFSKLPLQFSVLVDSSAPSCTEGHYMPRFVSPTPKNGEKISVTPLQEVEIQVKAVADYATVSNMIISGPLNISKHALSKGKYAIRWTPRREDLGDYFPMCFIAEGKSGSRIYQSEMRCVLVTVRHQHVEANVICTGTNMIVEIEKLHAVELHKDYLRLYNPACTLDSNGTHVLANFSLNACGTLIEEDEEYIIFKNLIISTDDPSSIVTRKHEVEISVSCSYKKKNNFSLQYTSIRYRTTVTEKGFGTLSYRFRLFQTSAYYREIDVIAYAAEYELGKMIYMQIESQSSMNNTELFIESCVATPYNDPNYQMHYTIIQDGCIVDDTVVFYKSNQQMVRFGMQAFQFIGMYEQVFISCSVMMCEAENPNTRCSLGCINSKVSQLSHHYHKREAPIQTSSHFISQGPLRLRRSAEHKVLNLNLVFIAGCLLAAVAMLCGVLIYRTRRTEVKNQPLNTYEI